LKVATFRAKISKFQLSRPKVVKVGFLPNFQVNFQV